MSPAGPMLRNVIEVATRQVRREGILAAGGAVAGVVPLTLVLAWIAGGDAGWRAPSAVPLAIVASTALVALALAAWLGRRWVVGVQPVVIAAAAEARQGLPAGSVRGLLELGQAIPRGTSRTLFQLAETEVSKTLAGRTPWELTGVVGEQARHRRQRSLMVFGGLVLTASVLGFISPERSRQAWAPLLHPVAHLSPPPMAPLVVEPGDVEVPRGGAMVVKVQAAGRSEVTLRWRAEGDVPRERTLAVMEDRATTRLAGIDAPLIYWVLAPDGAVSDTFHVTPLDPLLLSDLVVDVIYPAYLGREAERFEGAIPPLVIPQGTELRIRGRATRPLEDAILVREDGRSRIAFSVTADRFAGRWIPQRSGMYRWSLTDEAGGGVESEPAPLEIEVLGDQPPEVYVTFPGTDTILGPSLTQEVVADARDDHGIRSAVLVSWRERAGGGTETPVEQTLVVGEGMERVVVQGVIDARERGLLPGETIHYFVRVTDNSPAGQVAVSRTYTLRLPGRNELRERVGERASTLVRESASMREEAERLQRDTRSLAQRAARSTRGGSSGRSAGSGSEGGDRGRQSGERSGMSYRDAEEARAILERQERMLERVEEMQARTRALEEAMRAAGLQDPALQDRLREVSELYQQILSPETRQKLEELRASLEEMDPEAMQRALEQLSMRQDELKERLDQSIELLERAALEQQMNTIAQEARELAAQQEALAEAMEREGQPSPERQAQQEELARRAEDLKRQMEALQRRLSEQGESNAAAQAGEALRQTSEASEAMREAAEQARRKDGKQAGQSGDAAAQSLDQAAQTLEMARQAMAEGWKREAQETVEQAAADALELAQRQNELLQQMQQAQQSGESGQSGQSGQRPQPMAQGQQGQGQQGQGQQQGQSGQGQQGQGQQGEGQQGEGQQGGQGEQGSQGNQGGQGQQGGADPSARPGDPSGTRGGEAGPGGSNQLDAMRAEQRALQQGLEALGRNLADAGRRSAHVSPEVNAALGQAMAEMRRAVEAMEGAQGGSLPIEQARQAVDALNRLALELLANGEQIGQSQSGTGLDETLSRLADLARQQGSLNGQSSALLPLQLGQQATGSQMDRMAQQQREIARALDGLSRNAGGPADLLAQLDALAREAEAIARELSGGRISPEVIARQERLFHRLLDAGRTLEREEEGDERVAERPGNVGISRPPPLPDGVLNGGPRFPMPTPEQLRAVPPAYRRLIVEYFDRLNRAAERSAEAGEVR